MTRLVVWLQRGLYVLSGHWWYYSTACLHGVHRHCRNDRTLSGDPKVPNACKFCSARCICSCHRR